MQFEFGEDPGLVVKAAPVRADPVIESINPVLQQPNFCYILSGGPGSGKTSLLYHLLHGRRGGTYRNVFDVVHLFNPSDTCEFDDVVDHGDLDMEDLQEIIDDPENQGKHVCIILDDCVQSLKANSRALLKIFYNRRHLFSKKTGEEDLIDDSIERAIMGLDPKYIEDSDDDDDIPGSCSIFVTTQKYNKLPLAFRTAATGVFIFKPDARESKTVYDDVVSDVISERGDWMTLSHAIYNRPHNFLYVDKRTGTLHRNFIPIILKKGDLYL
jgi:hypothetical protein